MKRHKAAVVGGGAAGFFGAITLAAHSPDTHVVILEKGPQFLQKVRISGGGRCNVTHSCFDPRELTKRYPRGEKELISPFHQFQAADTVRWFEERGVKLKTEPDGRMFPTTDSSQTIIDCLLREAQKVGVELRAHCGVEAVEKTDAGFRLRLTNGEQLPCDRLLLATGGCRTPAQGALALSLGHTLQDPVPSLFTFQIEAPWLRALAGLSVPLVEASVQGSKLRERGPMLVTHWGLSGPAILRLSAWGARELSRFDYRFVLHVNWLPRLSAHDLQSQLEQRAKTDAAKMLMNTSFAPLPARLWEALIGVTGLDPRTRWAQLGKANTRLLAEPLQKTELQVSGKSLNKDEFVTCGGVSLKEVDFKTMESRITPGVYFAGELLDIDGITGGFNFQSAWTTGWIAGRAMASSLKP
ncbi:MAG TPA: NAD(P)/FAD-dependent oxidoreductase [Methylomirabilota bacterium]|nr:NAD(P)/FAD-dependent oxidoreductase [Methylomirabilota bacterium]